MRATKLHDEKMQQVSGGVVTQNDVGTHMFLCGVGAAALGIVGGLGSGITGLVYKVKKSNALKKGDAKSAARYGKIAKATGITAASCGGAFLLGVASAGLGFALVWNAAGSNGN